MTRKDFVLGRISKIFGKFSSFVGNLEHVVLKPRDREICFGTTCRSRRSFHEELKEIPTSSKQKEERKTRST